MIQISFQLIYFAVNLPKKSQQEEAQQVVTSSTKSNWILGVKSFFGNPYDGNTLKALEQASNLSGAVLKRPMWI